MFRKVDDPEVLFSKMVKEIGEIGAGMRQAVHPVSVVDGESFSVRMEPRPDARWGDAAPPGGGMRDDAMIHR